MCRRSVEAVRRGSADGGSVDGEVVATDWMWQHGGTAIADEQIHWTIGQS